jgi:hypothetical protein
MLGVCYVGTVLAINISTTSGTEKDSVVETKVLEGWELENDTHGGVTGIAG